MRKVIFDCDTGTDDTVALMLLVLSKKFDIAGITCVWGNQKVEDTSNNTLRVLDYLGSDIKVYKGCSEPLKPDNQKRRKEAGTQGAIYYTDEKGEIHHLHPQHLWIPETKRTVEEKHAVDFIIDTAMNSDETITLVPVGPTTNIATALLKEPRIAEKIEIVFMGGGVHRGNISPTAEANFFNDADAVKAILDSGVKCTIAALDATMSAALPVSRMDDLINSGNKYLKFFGEIVKWRADVEYNLGWLDGVNEPIHDPMAIAYMIDPSFVTKLVKHQVSIDDGFDAHAGSLIIDEGVGNKNVTIMEDADMEAYYKLLVDILGA